MAPAPISVVMCVFNGESTIDAAMASIAGQTLAPSEVVVVDDGSTDGTVERLKAWTNVVPLKVVELSTNGGTFNARNQGVANSTQPLVAFVDSDDLILPDHLAVLYALYEQQGGVIAPLWIRWEPGSPETLKLIASTKSRPRPLNQLRPLDNSMQRRSILRTNFATGVMMIERELYEDIGGMRSDKIMPDWDLAIRLVHSGVPIFSPRSVTYLYRLSPGGMMHESRVPRQELQTLLDALEMDWSAEELRIARQTARKLRANVQLAEAYDHARQGNPWRARVSGVRALGGGLRVKLRGSGMIVFLRASGMIVFPTRTTRLRDRT